MVLSGNIDTFLNGQEWQGLAGKAYSFKFSTWLLTLYHTFSFHYSLFLKILLILPNIKENIS